MNPEGRLQVAVFRAGASVDRVAINSSRPLQLPQVFRGQSPQQLLDTLPRLYSLCGTAQAAAALQACRQALRQPPAASLAQAQAMLVIMETAREHLWRTLLDGPQWLGEQPDRTALAPLGGLLPGLRRALFDDGQPFALDAVLQCDLTLAQAQIRELAALQQQVFGMPPEDWLQIDDPADYQCWLTDSDTPVTRLLRRVQDDGLMDLGRSEVAGLPPLPAAWLRQQMGGAGAADFIARPVWQGHPCETGSPQRQQHRPLLRCLVEQHGNGLLPRLVARLLELAETVGSLRQRLALLINGGGVPGGAAMTGTCEGIGIGQVEAARGRLVHRLVLKAGVVHDYRILAPTEWNFHPDGTLVRGLTGLQVKSEAQLRDRVALLINAIDPCVGYDLVLH